MPAKPGLLLEESSVEELRLDGFAPPPIVAFSPWWWWCGGGGWLLSTSSHRFHATTGRGLLAMDGERTDEPEDCESIRPLPLPFALAWRDRAVWTVIVMIAWGALLISQAARSCNQSLGNQQDNPSPEPPRRPNADDFISFQPAGPSHPPPPPLRYQIPAVTACNTERTGPRPRRRWTNVSAAK
ncbi:hypothetical protein CH63R_07348 [Colletotrichum higginsianum IMI 349063]|uniref:Uncharacterized protein n=1 Tax=Colletotrichum higginsianum (strain IMI 349063) TaxID=759273 RepID=A0A1B7Y927_COLHI|nr:hypothetical protein CH63R_07348 [Colletotrichum higginsianum IMI 349063]OBR08583.1 hypothetical protein CH63R_07348 [Colletotrichum higginsianum IMI 349063]